MERVATDRQGNDTEGHERLLSGGAGETESCLSCEPAFSLNLPSAVWRKWRTHGQQMTALMIGDTAQRRPLPPRNSYSSHSYQPF